LPDPAAAPTDLQWLTRLRRLRDHRSTSLENSMRTRIASIASITAAAAMLTACATADPYGPNNYPVSGSYPVTTTTYPVATYPAGAYPAGTYPAGTVSTANVVEWGRVSNIELVQAPSTGNSGNSTAGTLIGGAVGAVLGNQIGSGGGRAAATVLGAVGGAVVGNQIAKNRDGSYNSPTGAVYRVTVQTENGQWRSYDVSATGDLRVGDRVRIENNVLFRS
jgi:outer membrane lipoprotein SlyB